MEKDAGRLEESCDVLGGVVIIGSAIVDFTVVVVVVILGFGSSVVFDV